MSKPWKKLIAPIMITMLLVLYLLGFVVMVLFSMESIVLKIVGIIIPLSLIGVSLFVLVERIKEIRSGEEDDLGKY